MTPQKFCFRYDGSDEADKALELINETFKTDWVGCRTNYYTSSGLIGTVQPDYTLVPPAEFIRLMKGDEWQPKWGEEVEVSDNGDDWYKHIFVGKNPLEDSQYPFIIVTQSDVSGNFKFIRPIRKSLREELIDWANKKRENLLDGIPELLTIIDRHEKERGVEG